MKLRQAAAGLFVSAIAWGMASCGGSSTPTSGTTSNSGTTSTAGPTGASGAASSFTGKANAICRSIGEQLKALNAPGDPSAASSSDLPAWTHYLQQAIPLLTRGTAQLEGLIPPAAVQANYSTLVRSDQAQLRDTQAAEQAASGGDLSGFKAAVQKTSSDGSAGDTAAKSLGLTDCASG